MPQSKNSKWLHLNIFSSFWLSFFWASTFLLFLITHLSITRKTKPITTAQYSCLWPLGYSVNSIIKRSLQRGSMLCSVTRSGEISPLLQNFTSLAFLEVRLVFGENVNQVWLNKIMILGKSSVLKYWNNNLAIWSHSYFDTYLSDGTMKPYQAATERWDASFSHSSFYDFFWCVATRSHETRILTWYHSCETW